MRNVCRREGGLFSAGRRKHVSLGEGVLVCMNGGFFLGSGKANLENEQIGKQAPEEAVQRSNSALETSHTFIINPVSSPPPKILVGPAAAPFISIGPAVSSSAEACFGAGSKLESDAAIEAIFEICITDEVRRWRLLFG